jgi:phospholipase C
VHRAQFTRMPSGYRKLSAEDINQFDEDRFKIPWMPQQEPGVRPSTALPYELAATGAVSADGKSFEIALESGSKAGAPFHVYTPGKFRNEVKLRARAYAVAAGDRLTDAWVLKGFEKGRYHLRVCGPNGFLREFSGSASDPAVQIHCEYRWGDLELRIASHAQRAFTLAVQDHGYKSGGHSLVIEPGGNQAIAMSLEQSQHWYDFSVSITGVDGFLRRFAGRVETGQAGFSDPVMGRV